MRKPLDWAVIVAAILSLAGTIYIEATHRDTQNEHRITAVEQAHLDDGKRLDHIEALLDRLVDNLIGK